MPSFPFTLIQIAPFERTKHENDTQTSWRVRPAFDVGAVMISLLSCAFVFVVLSKPFVRLTADHTSSFDVEFYNRGKSQKYVHIGTEEIQLNDVFFDFTHFKTSREMQNTNIIQKKIDTMSKRIEPVLVFVAHVISHLSWLHSRNNEQAVKTIDTKARTKMRMWIEISHNVHTTRVDWLSFIIDRMDHSNEVQISELCKIDNSLYENRIRIDHTPAMTRQHIFLEKYTDCCEDNNVRQSIEAVEESNMCTNTCAAIKIKPAVTISKQTRSHAMRDNDRAE